MLSAVIKAVEKFANQGGLVLGICNGFQILPETGITGAYVLTGSMESPRERHTATKRTDGKVLVTGGLSGTGDLSTAELFDPATAVFTHAGNMEVERLAHTATLLMNVVVLVTGGNNTHSPNVLATAELFP